MSWHNFIKNGTVESVAQQLRQVPCHLDCTSAEIPFLSCIQSCTRIHTGTRINNWIPVMQKGKAPIEAPSMYAFSRLDLILIFLMVTLEESVFFSRSWVFCFLAKVEMTSFLWIDTQWIQIVTTVPLLECLGWPEWTEASRQPIIDHWNTVCSDSLATLIPRSPYGKAMLILFSPSYPPTQLPTN